MAAMLALLSFLSAPSLKEIQLVLFKAAILKDIKSLFDVYNPQTIPDLGVKFQTI